MDVRAQLHEPSGVLRAWLIRRSAYAGLCGALAGLICWVGAHFRLGAAWEAGSAILVAGMVVGIIHAGFAMGKRTSTLIMHRFARQVEAAAHGWGVPDFPRMGWTPYDHMISAVEALARHRQDEHQQVCEQLYRYRQLADEAPGFETFFSADGTLLWANTFAQQRVGLIAPAPKNIAQLIDAWVNAKDRAALRDCVAKACQGVIYDQVEVRLLQTDQHSYFWGQCRLMPRLDPGGAVVGVRLSIWDIQSRKDAETRLIEMVAALQRAQALKEHYLGRSNDERMRLSALLDIVSLGIVFIDRDFRVVYINQAATHILGLDNRDEIVGMRDQVLLDMSAALRLEDTEYREHCASVLNQARRSEPYDIAYRDGRVIREQSSPVSGGDDAQPIGRVWIFEDVTESLENQRRLTELAECDPLTGLLNRRRFHHELGRHLADSQRRDCRLGLVCFDFDGFKGINDRFGHQAGDEVLVRVTKALQSVVRRNELFFRLGGDEFAILVPHAQCESIQRLAQRIIDRAGEVEFDFSGSKAAITLSLGVAFVPDHGQDAEGLVHAADRALYRAKAGGKNRWHMAEIAA